MRWVGMGWDIWNEEGGLAGQELNDPSWHLVFTFTQAKGITPNQPNQEVGPSQPPQITQSLYFYFH